MNMSASRVGLVEQRVANLEGKVNVLIVMNGISLLLLAAKLLVI